MDLGPQTSDEEVVEAERILGSPFSHSHTEFLKIHDGAFLGVLLPGQGERYPTGVKIFSLAERLASTRE